MNAEEALAILAGEFAELLGIKPADVLTALKEGEEYKTSDQIKSYLSPKIADKLKGLVPATKLTNLKGKTEKETYESIEAKISDRFGVTGKISEGLLDKVHKLTLEPTAAGADEIKALKTAHKAEIKTLKASHLTALKTEKVGRVKDKLRSEALGFLEDENNNYLLPSKKSVRDGQLNRLLDDVLKYEHNGEPIQIIVKEGKLVPTDMDGQPLQNEQLNDISILNIVGKVASTGYFDVKEPSGRRTPKTRHAGAGEETVTIKYGKDQEIKAPTFDSKEDMNAFLLSEKGANLKPAERVAIRAANEAAFTEQNE